jgi:hypothetical protein
MRQRGKVTMINGVAVDVLEAGAPYDGPLRKGKVSAAEPGHTGERC